MKHTSLVRNSQEKARSFSRASQIRFFVDLLDAIGTDYSVAVKEKLLSREPFDLGAPEPANYETAADYFADAQSYALLSKHCLLVPESNLAPCDVAVEKFYDGELACLLTNQRFRMMNFTFRERSLLERARLFCHHILKTAFIGVPDFGPGSTVELRGKDSNIISKLNALPETTPHNYAFVVHHILDTMPHYALASGMVIKDHEGVRLGPQLATIVDASEFLTVPKNFKTERPIAIEPSGNMLMQKAMGSAIRTRLRQFGFDLDSAPDLHGQLARQGSVDGSFATIDLASASDTIAYEFVRFMLPQDWFNNLNAARTRVIRIGKHLKRLEKFSSMGNGYTFELESLLFLCLMLASREAEGCLNTRLSIFGDDMICHPKVADTLIPLLTVSGFTINKEKTYLTGPFRESCGHDYFRGIRVTPVYFKEKEDDYVSSIYYHCNRVVALSGAFNFGIGNSGRFKRIWLDLLQRLPKNYKFGGPKHLGDQVLHGHPECRSKQGRIAVIARKSRKFSRFSTASHTLACALYGVPSAGVIPRGAKYTLDVQWLRMDKYPSEVYWITET